MTRSSFSRNCSNDNKRRSLHTSVGVFKSLEPELGLTRCKLQHWATPGGRPSLKTGTKIANLSVIVTGPNPKVQMKVTPRPFR